METEVENIFVTIPLPECPLWQGSTALFFVGFSQEEYEELLRYAVVTPNTEAGASQLSHSKGEAVPDVKIPTIIDDILQNPGYVYYSRCPLI